MRNIVLASDNPGKIREISQVFNPHDLQVIAQSEFSVPAAIEDAPTFVENALRKARNAAHYSKLPVLADDSGLEVDYLQGAPGVRSARYAGEHAQMTDNITKLLSALQDVPTQQRSANFRCVLVYLRHADDPAPLLCQGVWRGRILTALQGTGGFGYDPIFYVPEHDCSAAELTSTQKNTLSHRGQAMQAMLAQLISHD